MHNFTWNSSTTPKLEKINDTVPRKRPNRRKDGQRDRPYFIGPFQLLPGVLKWHDFIGHQE